MPATHYVLILYCSTMTIILNEIEVDIFLMTLVVAWCCSITNTTVNYYLAHKRLRKLLQLHDIEYVAPRLVSFLNDQNTPLSERSLELIEVYKVPLAMLEYDCKMNDERLIEMMRELDSLIVRSIRDKYPL